MDNDVYSGLSWVKRKGEHWKTDVRTIRQGCGEATSVMESRFCSMCGNLMYRAGACFVCRTCGETSGCS
jgi:hypothetical protein